MQKNIYWIGGSPCSGKSTMAGKLEDDFGFHYYRCDDHLERYLSLAAERGSEICKRMKSSSIDEIFLRPVEEQVNDEFTFYRDIFEIVIGDLHEIDNNKTIIIEGAGLFPRLLMDHDIDMSRYMAIVPTADFQLNKYSQREWVSHYLRDSANADKAYNNWMKRDIEFAKIVRAQAEANCLKVLVVDGSVSIEDSYKSVKKYFGLPV